MYVCVRVCIVIIMKDSLSRSVQQISHRLDKLHEERDKVRGTQNLLTLEIRRKSTD